KGGPPTPGDSYLTQLTKLFPAEIVTIYPAGMALLATDKIHAWWFALLCAAAMIAVRLLATSGPEGSSPQFVAVIASLISFLLWVVARGDWFLPGPVPANAAAVTAACALVWTYVAPAIVNRFESST
ncbi:hypothetical protein DBR17_09085, partial [Sphingomonas sp. HMWF008]